MNETSSPVSEKPSSGRTSIPVLTSFGSRNSSISFWKLFLPVSHSAIWPQLGDGGGLAPVFLLFSSPDLTEASRNVPPLRLSKLPSEWPTYGLTSFSKKTDPQSLSFSSPQKVTFCILICSRMTSLLSHLFSLKITPFCLFFPSC